MERRLKLDALDPAADAARWEGRIGRILAEAAPILRRRREPAGPLAALGELLRPALGVAFAAAAISGVFLLRDAEAPRLAGIPEEMGLPAPVAEWLVEGREPTADDLLAALEPEIP